MENTTEAHEGEKSLTGELFVPHFLVAAVFLGFLSASFAKYRIRKKASAETQFLTYVNKSTSSDKVRPNKCYIGTPLFALGSTIGPPPYEGGSQPLNNDTAELNDRKSLHSLNTVATVAKIDLESSKQSHRESPNSSKGSHHSRAAKKNSVAPISSTSGATSSGAENDYYNENQSNNTQYSVPDAQRILVASRDDLPTYVDVCSDGSLASGSIMGPEHAQPVTSSAHVTPHSSVVYPRSFSPVIADAFPPESRTHPT